MLFIEHGKELASTQIDIDFDQYYALDVQGILRILTVRDAGQLVGYAFVLFGPPANHKQELWAQTSMYWLDPVLRQGWTGVKLFKTLIHDAKVMGASKLVVASTIGFEHNRVTKLLQRLGLKPTETLHSMRL